VCFRDCNKNKDAQVLIPDPVGRKSLLSSLTASKLRSSRQFRRVPLPGILLIVLCAQRGMQSSCSTTIFDPHWDQHLRILLCISVAKANDGALDRADCTTIAAAKQLNADADCLQQVDAKLRSIFMRLVSEAEHTGTRADTTSSLQ
jgi:hypothetical protein